MVVQDPSLPPLHAASRLYFGIHHPIQYNVKVKDIGFVTKEHIGRLCGYWAMSHVMISHSSNDMNGSETKATGMAMSDMEMSEKEGTSDEDSSDEDSSDEVASDKETGDTKMTNTQASCHIVQTSPQVLNPRDTTDNGRVDIVANRSPGSDLPPEQSNLSSPGPGAELVKGVSGLDPGKMRENVFFVFINTKQALNLFRIRRHSSRREGFS
jgi:hypothetical protein